MPSPALHDDIITDIAWLCSQPSRAALRASSRYLYTVVTPVLVRDISSTIVHTRAMLSLLHAMLRIPRQFDHIRLIVIRQNRGDSRYLPDLTAVLTEFVVHAARLEHISIPRFERSLQSSPQLRTALLLHPCITSLHFDFLGEHCLHLLRERSTSRTVTVDDADVSPLDLGAALATSQNTLRGLRISGMHNIFLVGDVVWSQVVRLVLLNMRISMPSLAHCFPNLKFLTIFPIEPSRALLGQQVTLAALAHLATNHMALPLLNITCPRLHIDVTVTENRGLRDREESSQMMTALNACSPLSVRVQGRAIPHPHWLRQIRTVSTMRLLDVDLQMTVEDADEDARVSLFLYNVTDLLDRNFDLAYIAVTFPKGLAQQGIAIEGFRARVLQCATNRLLCWEVRYELDGTDGVRREFFRGTDGWESRVEPDEASRLYDMYKGL